MAQATKTQQTSRSAGARDAAAKANLDRVLDHVPHAGCGCGVDDDGSDRKAIGVDPDIKDRNLKRLRRIEGQIRGLQKMVEEDRYCADIMTQISSAHEALRAVGRELMRNHLKHCATSAIKSSGEEASAMYDELVDMMYKHSR
ncbi:MAG: metal-sensitive transcriptional regulator [Gemmatimonadaceae bacterium]